LRSVRHSLSPRVPEAAEPAAREVEQVVRAEQARALEPARQLAELPGARGQALAAVQAEPPVLPEVPQAAEVLLRDTPVPVRAAALPKRGPRTRM